ncbi:MAG: hypothetical protein ACI4S9_04270 [Christensenellales bacterium]
MKKYFSVLKLLLKNTYTDNHLSRKKKVAYYALICVAAIPILVFACFFVSVFAKLAANMNIVGDFLVFLITAVQIAVLFFGIVSMMSYMFFSKDAEFLAGLPVKNSVIYAAKFTMVYIAELIISGALLLPSLITFGVTIGISSPVYYIVGVLSVLFMPVLPLVLVSILVFPIMYVVSFFKNRGALAGVVLIALFAGVMGIYMSAVNSMPEEGEFSISPLFEAIMKGMYNVLLPNKLVVDVMLTVGGAGTVALNFLFYLLSVFLLLAISVFFSSLFYRRGVMSQLETQSSSGGKKVEVVKNSQLKSYLKKDFLCLIRDTGFAFNSFSGIILSPLLTIFVVKTMLTGVPVSEEEVLVLTNSSLYVVGFILMYNMLLLCGVNYCASAAITRENRAFYINKVIPVSPRLIVKAKLLFANIVTFVGVILVIAVLLAFDLLIPFYALLTGLVLLIFGTGLNAMGLKRDLARPKLDWNNTNEAVKNNVYMMVPMFIALAVGIGILVLGVILEVIGGGFVSYVFWAVSFLTALAVAIFAQRSLNKHTDEYFRRIEA